MTNTKCPSCGSPNVEKIDNDRYQCPYCGTIFSESKLPKENINSEYSQKEDPQNTIELPKSGSILATTLLRIYLILMIFAAIGTFLIGFNENWHITITAITASIATWLIIKNEKLGFWLIVIGGILEIIGTIINYNSEENYIGFIEPIIEIAVVYSILQLKNKSIKYWDILEYKLSHLYKILLLIMPLILFLIGTGIKFYNDNNYSFSGSYDDAYEVCDSDSIFTFKTDLDNEPYEYNQEIEDTLVYIENSSINSVDLGLSVLWSDRNIGAYSVTDHGVLIGWGAMDYQNTSKDLNEYPISNPPHSISQTNYDVAKAMYGGDWRLPTLEELKELKDECTWEVVDVNGEKVFKVIGPNENYIYLPFAGYRDGTKIKREGTWGFVWSGDLYEGNSQYAANLTFSVDGKVSTSGFYRYAGESIRPVMDK